jgi:hypothetical protein
MRDLKASIANVEKLKTLYATETATNSNVVDSRDTKTAIKLTPIAVTSGESPAKIAPSKARGSKTKEKDEASAGPSPPKRSRKTVVGQSASTVEVGRDQWELA